MVLGPQDPSGYVRGHLGGPLNLDAHLDRTLPIAPVDGESVK